MLIFLLTQGRVEALWEANMNFHAFMFVSASLLRKLSQSRVFVCIFFASMFLKTGCDFFFFSSCVWQNTSTTLQNFN